MLSKLQLPVFAFTQPQFSHWVLPLKPLVKIPKANIRTWASPMNAPGSWSTGFGFYAPEAIGDNHGKKPD